MFILLIKQLLTIQKPRKTKNKTHENIWQHSWSGGNPGKKLAIFNRKLYCKN